MIYKIRVDRVNIEETGDIKELTDIQKEQAQREWANSRACLTCEFVPVVAKSKNEGNNPL